MKEGRKKKQGQKKTLQEKRSSVRVPVNMIVKYGMDGNYLFDVSKNIAQGGVFIKTDTPSEVGALLDIHLSLPDSKKKIKTQGKVVWVQKPMKQQENIVPGMGIQFLSLDEKSRDMLHEYLDKNELLETK